MSATYAAITLADTWDNLRVVLLGTGTPNTSPDKFGPSTLVQAGKHNLLFDTGRGNPIRLWQLKVPLGSIEHVFMTHYNSDHVNGLSDLWLTGWLGSVYADRKSALNITGPTGLKTLTDGLEAAFANNTKIRIEDQNFSPQSIRLISHEFSDQDRVVYEKAE